MNHVAYLKRIRLLRRFMLLCAILLTASGLVVGGVVALIFGFFVVWRYHRCPHCAGEVDIRLRLDRKTCCPLCGFYLKDGTEPKEMREERERAEAEAKAKAEAEAAAAAEAAEQAAAEAEAEQDPASEAEPDAEAPAPAEAGPKAETAAA